jgi:hypothetical protein
MSEAPKEFETIPDEAVTTARLFLAERGYVVEDFEIRGMLSAVRSANLGEMTDRSFREATANYNRGFDAGTKIGHVEGASAELDTFAPYAVPDPTPYGAAIEALHAAVRLVQPIEAYTFEDANLRRAGDVTASVVAVADGLMQWLSEHVDAEPDTGTIDGE